MAESKIVKTSSTWTTIWTNPNPNQSFAESQRINVDLSAYSEVCFVLKGRINGTAKYYSILAVGTENAIISAIAERIWERYGIDVMPSYIAFGASGVVQSYGARTDDTSVAIPLEIWAK